MKRFQQDMAECDNRHGRREPKPRTPKGGGSAGSAESTPEMSAEELKRMFQADSTGTPEQIDRPDSIRIDLAPRDEHGNVLPGHEDYRVKAFESMKGSALTANAMNMATQANMQNLPAMNLQSVLQQVVNASSGAEAYQRAGAAGGTGGRMLQIANFAGVP